MNDKRAKRRERALRVQVRRLKAELQELQEVHACIHPDAIIAAAGRLERLRKHTPDKNFVMPGQPGYSGPSVAKAGPRVGGTITLDDCPPLHLPPSIVKDLDTLRDQS